MKSLVEITMLGLVATVTLVLGTLIPYAIVKVTLDKETVTTLQYEKGQHGLLALFYSSQGDKSVYKMLSERALFENRTCSSDADCAEGYKCKSNVCQSTITTKPTKDRLDKIMGKGKYCITTGDFVESAIPSSNEILSGKCPSADAEFTALLVVPYNRNSPSPLIKLIGIGVE